MSQAARRHGSRRWRSGRSASEAVDEAVGPHLPQAARARRARSDLAAVGELVMEELRHLDEVAYVRFASVYRSFQDVEAFREEIDQAAPAAQAARGVARAEAQGKSRSAVAVAR